MQFNEVTLKSGRKVVAKAAEVPNNELVSCFDRFYREGGGMKSPKVLVNGRKHTPDSLREMTRTVNHFSQRMGGCQVY